MRERQRYPLRPYAVFLRHHLFTDNVRASGVNSRTDAGGRSTTLRIQTL
ncbi:hypothetical protein KCP75_18220 [Salmonella enterica subsp. enterica]|nr:hypothetical protein KCP75_18220 [Salmonella enterica subsp. enterica]